MNQEAAPKPDGYPDDWHVIDFDQFTTLQRGKDLTRDEFGAGDVPVAGSNGIIGFHHTANVRGPGVTVGRSGSVGRVTFYERDFWAHNTALFVKDYHGNDPQFAAFFLEFLNLARFGSGASVPTLDRNAFRFMPVVVPLKEEQRRIGTVLELAKQAIGLEERQLGLTSELKKSLMQKLFAEGLRGEPQKETEIGPAPESWEVVTLGSIARVGNGSTPKRGNRDYWDNGRISWLNSARIHDLFITEPDQFVTDIAVRECHLPRVPANSLLIAITGQGKTLGNSALTKFETCINQHLAYANFVSPDVVPEFVLWYMQTRYEHLRAVSQAGGSTKGALTCAYLKTYPLPVPPLKEQNEIAEVFLTLHRKEKYHAQRRDALKELARTLLHQLMTAQIRVNDLDLSEFEKLAA